MALPALRAVLKILPFKHEGKDVFLVMDHQEALFEHQVILPPIGFVVASFLDGKRDVAGVQREIAEKLNGVQVKAEDIESVVQDLDEHFLLESDRLVAKRREIEEAFLKLPTRPNRFVDGEAEEVRKEIDEYYASDAGSGKPDGRRATPLSGILAPHIDYNRGGHCYTWAYREVAERSDADVYVILGVAHLSPPNPFIVTSKDYATPLGTARTDRDIVSSLEKRLGRRIFEHELVHRSEHSAEFQAAFLKHALPAAAFTVVPILCSAFERWSGDASPSTVPEIEAFLGALQESVKGRRVCYVGGVDFAHVGPVFGDQVALDQKLIEWMMAGDTRSLQACADGQAETFWNSVMADGNRRHVCGLSATYATLRLLGDFQGKVLKYGFAPDPQGGLVSFASMAFTEAPRIVRP